MEKIILELKREHSKINARLKDPDLAVLAVHIERLQKFCDGHKFIKLRLGEQKPKPRWDVTFEEILQKICSYFSFKKCGTQ